MRLRALLFGLILPSASGGVGQAEISRQADEYPTSALTEWESGVSRPGEMPGGEQSLRKALAEIPRLAFTARQPAHLVRYIPMGFPASREKYGLDFNGNVFINKYGVKAIKEDLERTLWEGDEIYFRIGTGAIPDFRERESGALQSLLEDDLPLVSTRWRDGSVDYEEQAYATMLAAPLDDARLRGDEPRLLHLRVTAHNAAAKMMDCRTQLHEGKTDQVRAACGQARESDDIDKLVAVGMLIGESGQSDRARQLFAGALELDPESPEANYDLGLTYFEQKDFVRVRLYLQTAGRSRPNFFEAVALYGTVLYLLREDAAAVATLRHAHELRPENSAVKNLLAELERSAPR